MAYEAESPPVVAEDLRPLAEYLFRELQRIAISFQEVENVQLEELHADLDKPRDGMIILVDGVDFNPGAGAGFYGRSAGAWVLLG